MSWPPSITVATIVEKNNTFLIVEEVDNGKTVFNQPAGHVEPHESLFTAAKRETLEETQWQVELTAFVGTYVYTSPINSITYLRFCFSAKPLEFFGQKPLDQGIIAAHWFGIEELRTKSNQLRSPLVLKCLDDYLMGKQYPLEIIYEHLAQ